MHCVRVDGERFVFHIGHREKRFLLEALRLYPLIPASYHRVSRSANTERLAEMQQLLDEALAAQKRESRRKVVALLNEPQRFQPVEKGYQLVLTFAEADWLLQVLNDVRVGSWLQLGCPDHAQGRHTPITEENARHHLALEVCGHFQMALLNALARGA